MILVLSPSFMLVIQPDQIAALGAARWQEFVSRVVQHCQFRHPEACAGLTGDALGSCVAAGMARARTYGFVETDDFLRYLDLLFTVGPNADQEPRFAAILAETTYTPATRLDVIFGTLADAESPAEPDAAPRELPDATWPEAKPRPVPPPPVLAPPTASCMQRPPWAESGGEDGATGGNE
jgi:hypothetical protein